MMKNLSILLGCCALAGIIAYVSADNSPKMEPAQKIETAQSIPAPAAIFTDLSEKKYPLSDYRGKGVVLNIWATWCAPCVIEFPQMIELAKDKDDIMFVFLSIDAKAEDVNRFLKKYAPGKLSANVLIAHDPQQTTARDLFQTYKLPETFLIDSNGNIRDKIIGADVEWNGPEMSKKIDSLSD